MQIVTTRDRLDLTGDAMAPLRAAWPTFALHDPVSIEYRDAFEACFPQYDVLLVDNDQVLANAAAVALRWNGSVATLPAGYDGAVVQSVTEHHAGVPADTLCIMSATVHPSHLGRGLAAMALTALRDRAAQAGLPRVIVPVRPTLKAGYPLTPMADFLTWLRPDGLHLDPWIRTHQRLGATILAPAPRSMVVTGTVAEWEKWTAMAFPQTSSYVVPGALDLVHIDRTLDRGHYEETNLWMQHH
ncbi:GNAT family N-acetyltransferase [Kutzneria sp. NPDC051319]|uniref:GNAT family N-acetyltransferase n=1 Tax=Kutzneria sp. NPDC051319 TaxID=3155047 RepID=UPI00343FA2DC